MCFGFGYLPGCCESGDKKGTTACSVGKWCCVLGSDVFCISVSVHPYGVIRAHYGHGSALSGTCVMAKQSCHMVMSCIAPHLRHALRSSHDEPKEHSSGRPTTPSDNLSDGVAGYLSKHTRSCSTQPRLDLPPPDRLRTVASFATGKWMGRIGEIRGPWESVDLDRMFIIRAKGERQVCGTYRCCSEAVGAID